MQNTKHCAPLLLQIHDLDSINKNNYSKFLLCALDLLETVQQIDRLTLHAEEFVIFNDGNLGFIFYAIWMEHFSVIPNMWNKCFALYYHIFCRCSVSFSTRARMLYYIGDICKLHKPTIHNL